MAFAAEAPSPEGHRASQGREQGCKEHQVVARPGKATNDGRTDADTS